MRFNFGDTPFKFPPSSGYSATSKVASSVARGSVKKGAGHKTPMALIIEPSRELAQQTYDSVTLFKKHLPSPGIRYCSEYVL